MEERVRYDQKIVVQWFAEHGIVAVPEYRFDRDRKWRFDFALAPANHPPLPTVEECPNVMDYFMGYKMLALEVEGGVWTGGRHTRGTGFVKDMEKYNAAAVLGWRILRVTPDNLCTMDTIEMIREALCVTMSANA